MIILSVLVIWLVLAIALCAGYAGVREVQKRHEARR